MSRHGIQIDEYHLKETLNVGIERSDRLLIWEAAVKAGASLDELQKIEEGKYPNWFLSRMVMWYIRHQQYAAHVSDAEASHLRKKAKKK